ncbi:SGNH/GDSL hydrolase family protein [Flavobacterium luminosum]|uniref:SGNH/GDSL hydrolase family protein n=1 Tax=Flavobacterium luminosum TaxID=2949086 RepID=A0ABT0TRI4_9FLAO|nr:SGNH/GDSL hydrolase family protein [Flavobacterium sp. HXWNR70]MCL9810113.1 SGNH/GDSL hydrolase family protein [Flavobacterium sp. HXWNR70]
MTTKFKSIFRYKVLIATNLITMIFLMVILVKENYPKKLLRKIQYNNSEVTAKKESVTEEELSAMNNTFQLKFKDYVEGKGNRSFKVLIIGNSLANHAIAKNIGWTHESGMAATNINKDYAHLLLDKLSKKLPNKKITMRVANFSHLERNPNLELYGKIDDFVNFKPNIVIFQLGENVKDDNLLLFQKKYIELINSFKKENKNITICTTSFFPSLHKNNLVQIVSSETNSFIVDLSHLTLIDKENYAKYERNYQGDQTKWKASGIGLHPGDKGMKSIADELFITINAIISQQKVK